MFSVRCWGIEDLKLIVQGKTERLSADFNLKTRVSAGGRHSAAFDRLHCHGQIIGMAHRLALKYVEFSLQDPPRQRGVQSRVLGCVSELDVPCRGSDTAADGKA